MNMLEGHFRSVLILTSQEVHARRDKMTMKQFLPDLVRWYASGSEAIDFISRNSVDLILCDTELTDMTGNKFLQLLRKNMKLRKLPVVMVTLENHKHNVLDSINAGCTGYVLRPYSLETFERHISLAYQLETYKEIDELQLQDAQEMISEGNFDDAIDAFEEIVSMQDEAQRYYDMGNKFLMQQLYGKAIVSFKKAVKINDLYAEAYKGLADAYKGKGDDDKCAEFLKKAADVYAQFDKLEETKELFIEILKYESGTPNPFNSLGVKLRRQGDYAGALHAYEQAVELTPEDENIYYNISKAFYFMGDMDKAQARVTQALEIHPGFTEAGKLYKRLTGQDFTPPEGAEAKKPRPEGAASAKDED